MKKKQKTRYIRTFPCHDQSEKYYGKTNLGGKKKIKRKEGAETGTEKLRNRVKESGWRGKFKTSI